jgi:hypothetical protein
LRQRAAPTPNNADPNIQMLAGTGTGEALKLTVPST